jgi:hypothetical protein
MRSGLFVSLVVGSLLAVGGCSAGGAAWTGFNMGKNLTSKDSHLKIWLDGQVAEQNMIKKAATGYSAWKVKRSVSTSPVLRFEIDDPASFGRITSVIVNVYQKFEADYSHQPEFTLVAHDANNPQAQMRPGVEYDLSNPGSGIRVLNLTNQDVGGVDLVPGKEYMLQITVRADRSETAQVYFKT